MSKRPTPSGLPTPPPEPRANSAERPKDRVRGWLPEAATRSDARGTEYARVGPGTSAWHATERGKGK
jgi:hypothetical protein